MRGWIYIITTKAMPDLLKVGFTLKDPNLRAQELGRTGLPHPYVVEYEVLAVHPRAIEQKVHAILAASREGREWFRCSVPDAIAAIQGVAGSNAILEKIRNIRKADPSSDSIALEELNSKEFRRNITYSGLCIYCRNSFSVTLTRYDAGARCPNCLKMNRGSDF